MKSVIDRLIQYRDDLTGVYLDNQDHVLGGIDSIVAELQARADAVQELRSAMKELQGRAYNPFEEGWNMALRFAIDRLERGKSCSMDSLLDANIRGR